MTTNVKAITDIKSTNLDKVKYILVTYIILASSGGGLILSDVFFLGFVNLILFFAIVLKYNILKQFMLWQGIIVSFLVLYSIGVSFVFNATSNYTFFARYIFVFNIAMISIYYIKEDFFLYYEKAIFVLFVIGLIFFIWQILDTTLLFNLLKSFSNLFGIEDSLYMKVRAFNVNAIIYTINEETYTNIWYMKRNCGFAFEPGFYSFFLVLAIFVLFYKEGSLKISKRIIFYLFILLTTQSTTGILTIFIVFLFFGFNSINIKNLFVFVILLVLFISVFLYFDFGANKISSVVEENDTITTYESAALHSPDGVISMGRIVGFEYYFLKTMKVSPIFGFCGMDKYGHDNDIIGNLTTANGFSVLLYNFGLLGILLYVVALYKSCNYLVKKDLKMKMPFFFYLIVFTYIFSFPVGNTIIMIYFLIYGIRGNLLAEKNLRITKINREV